MVASRRGLSGKVRFFTAYLVGSGGRDGGAFVAVRGIGSLENLGIPDALRLLYDGSMFAIREKSDSGQCSVCCGCYGIVRLTP